MAPSYVPLALLLLASFQLMAVSRPTCRHGNGVLPGNVVQNAHHLLRDLERAEPFPDHCSGYNVTFPDSALPAGRGSPSQCPRALWVVYESLRGMKDLLEEHGPPVRVGGATWDEAKLDTFQNLQYRLVVLEGRCLSNQNTSEEVSSYFSNVTAVVEQQDSAPCGWLVLARDVLLVLKSTLQQRRFCFSWPSEATPTGNRSHAH